MAELDSKIEELKSHYHPDITHLLLLDALKQGIEEGILYHINPEHGLKIINRLYKRLPEDPLVIQRELILLAQEHPECTRACETYEELAWEVNINTNTGEEVALVSKFHVLLEERRPYLHPSEKSLITSKNF